jgi:hypothetical protein
MRRSQCPSYALREKKQDLQLIAMLILINIQSKTANLFPIDNDSVRFVIGRINTAFNVFSGDDLSVVINATVAFTEFQYQKIKAREHKIFLVLLFFRVWIANYP